MVWRNFVELIEVVALLLKQVNLRWSEPFERSQYSLIIDLTEKK